MQAGKLLEVLIHHPAQAMDCLDRQGIQGHQVRAHPQGGDRHGLARVEVGRNAAPLVIGRSLDEPGYPGIIDGEQTGLAAPGQIRNHLIGLTRDHEGGVQAAITQALQPIGPQPGGGGKILGLPAHGLDKRHDGDPVPAVDAAKIDPFSRQIPQAADPALFTDQQGHRFVMEPIEGAQRPVGTLVREGAGAMDGVVEHIGLHQGELALALLQILQVGKGSLGAPHAAAQAIWPALFVEQAAEGATDRVVDAGERPRADGEVIAGVGARPPAEQGKQGGEQGRYSWAHRKPVSQQGWETHMAYLSRAMMARSMRARASVRRARVQPKLRRTNCASPNWAPGERPTPACSKKAMGSSSVRPATSIQAR